MSEFISNLVHRTNRDKSSPESNTALSAKSKQDRRRAQVRNAQRKHRERRESYVNATANSVRALRDFNKRLMEENALLQATIRSNSIAPPLLLSGDPHQLIGNVDFPQPNSQEQPFQFRILQKSAFQDEAIEVRPLHESKPKNADQQYLSDSGLSGTSSSLSPSPMGYIENEAAASFSTGLHTPSISFNPNLDNDQQQQLAFAAADFILTLEHPCMAHMHELADPAGSHNHTMSHQIMWAAPSLATSSAAISGVPNPIVTTTDNNNMTNIPTSLSTQAQQQQQQHFQQPYHPLNASRTTWTTASATLEKLISLSACLSLAHGEITPVQAWYKLVQHPAFKQAYALCVQTNNGRSTGLDADTSNTANGKAQGSTSGGAVGRLLKSLEESLSGEVKCYGFGAVLDEEFFETLLSRAAFSAGRDAGAAWHS